MDFTYELANPRAAMEITAVVSPEVNALGSALVKVERDIDEVVRDEHLGTWAVGIRVGTTARGVREPLIEFIRARRRSPSELLLGPDVPHELSSIGIVSIARLQDSHDEFSMWPPISDDLVEAGFAEHLRDAVGLNADKLAEARPRETHLVVAVERGGLSSDPRLTPAPALPASVDVLWVLLGYYTAKYTYRLWRTNGDRSWELLRHPLGYPSSRCVQGAPKRER